MQISAETIIYGYFHFTKNDKLEFPKLRKIKDHIMKEDSSIYVDIERNSIGSCVELCKDLWMDKNQNIWFEDLGEGLTMENRFLTNLFNDCCDGDRNDIPIRDMIYDVIKSVEEGFYKKMSVEEYLENHMNPGKKGFDSHIGLPLRDFVNSPTDDEKMEARESIENKRFKG